MDLDLINILAESESFEDFQIKALKATILASEEMHLQHTMLNLPMSEEEETLGEAGQQAADLEEHIKQLRVKLARTQRRTTNE